MLGSVICCIEPQLNFACGAMDMHKNHDMIRRNICHMISMHVLEFVKNQETHHNAYCDIISSGRRRLERFVDIRMR